MEQQPFSNIRFKYIFRTYQQRVLDRAPSYLDDGRIHIVAAPGSGKTILGLELIRMLSRPALILSPSVTIRMKWGERNAECFLPEQESLASYVSNDLQNPGPLTCATYQALYAYGDMQALADAMKEAGVRTLCLDEAHHLRREWQKSLELFLQAADGGFHIIALTATPPYDAGPAEWNRYRKICGEIDEEIFVPELVADGVLCPHQDYICFNLPTEDETALLEDHRNRAAACLKRFGEEALFERALEAAGMTEAFAEHEALFFRYRKDFLALFACAAVTAEALPDSVLRLLAGQNETAPDFLQAQRAFSFVVSRPDLFTEDISRAFRHTLAEYALLQRGTVCFHEDPALVNRLVSSAAKLDSIAHVARTEAERMGGRLRMLVLTDHIKKEALSLLGSDEPLPEPGAVTVLEVIRRACKNAVPAAVLTGSVVLVPAACAPALEQLAAERNVFCGFYELPEKARKAGFTELRFAEAHNEEKVSLLTEAFRRGVVRILIGTRALLGEGWDAPCINTLVLASYVGSFVTSNQMRGRAIRRDPDVPDKTANIWHLVTAEPGVRDFPGGSDMELLKRRMDAFMGPAYDRDVIENGYDRIRLGLPTVTDLNERMLQLSADRDGMRTRWERALFSGGVRKAPDILETCLADRQVMPAFYTKENKRGQALSVCCTALCAAAAAGSFLTGNTAPELLSVLFAAGAAFCIRRFSGLLRRVRLFGDPASAVETLAQAVLRSLRETGDIRDADAQVQVLFEKQRVNASETERVHFALTRTSVYEKNLFARAMEELLSPMENPRYVLVRRKRKNAGRRNLMPEEIYDFAFSYACPSVLGNVRERADRLAKQLSAAGETFEAVYTQNDAGAEILVRCLKESYINVAGVFVERRRELSSWQDKKT